MSVVINGSGTITGITAGGLPDATITQAELATGVAGTGPAFSAYNSTGTSMTQNTWTKIQFQTKEFDTASAFINNATFQPTVAGYYQLNAAVAMSANAAQIYINFYKNGSAYKAAPNAPAAAGSLSSGVAGSCLVYLNGSTDYVEVYSYQTATTQNTQTGAVYTWFQGSMTRAA